MYMHVYMWVYTMCMCMCMYMYMYIMHYSAFIMVCVLQVIKYCGNIIDPYFPVEKVIEK